MKARPEPGKRVRDAKGNTGRLLRYETYPGTGYKKWATVKWDHRIAASRVEPDEIEEARN